MSDLRITVSDVVAAPADQVYAVITDYHKGHPAILPKPPFGEVTIEQGGVGAGTVVRVPMSVMGNARIYRLTVSEPEPGRVMAEGDPNAGTFTTFALESLGPTHTQVTITTDFRLSLGFRGLLERLTMPSIVRPIYRKELKNLQTYLVANP
jgi:hypothetical protein